MKINFRLINSAGKYFYLSCFLFVSLDSKTSASSRFGFFAEIDIWNHQTVRLSYWIPLFCENKQLVLCQPNLHSFQWELFILWLIFENTVLTMANINSSENILLIRNRNKLFYLLDGFAKSLLIAAFFWFEQKEKSKLHTLAYTAFRNDTMVDKIYAQQSTLTSSNYCFGPKNVASPCKRRSPN